MPVAAHSPVFWAELGWRRMRWFNWALALLLVSLNLKLWFGDDGIRDVHQLESDLAELQLRAAELEQRNRALAAEVADLKSGLEAVEERAREDLGMIKPGEVYFQYLEAEHP